MNRRPDSICFNLGLAVRRVQRRYEEVFSLYGLTAGQYFALTVLWREDGLKFKELAERLAIEGPTLTGTLDRLERAGFVERRDDPDDRRSLRIWVTAQGWGVRPQAQAVAAVLDEQIRSGFTLEEFEVFKRVLDALPARLDARPNAASAPTAS